MGKKKLVFALFVLLGHFLSAQERAMDIVAGAVYPVRTGDQAANAKPQTGLTFGLLYRRKNEKGDIWSAGVEYQLLKNTRKVVVNNREETETERFEMMHLRGCPLVWTLGQKKRTFIEAGVFANILLHEEAELRNNLTNNTKLLQRLSLGPSLALGVQLGESMRKSLIIGLRDDYGAVSFGKKPGGGKATPLKFNTISLYVGLGI